MNVPNIDLLNIRHFRAVAAISETKNLTRAAQKLCVTQPAVSQQLKELEQILGVSLFVRSKKQMIITKAGEEVLLAAGNILNELEDVNLKIAKLVHGEIGELRIGMHCIHSYQWIPGVLRKMQKAYPKVTLKLGNSHRPKKELLENIWDIVIAAVPFEHPLLEQQMLFSDDVVLLVHPKDPIAHEKNITPGIFSDSRFISLTTREQDLIYNFVIAPDDPETGIFMTVEQPEAVLSLVKEKFGIAVFPRWAAKNAIRKKEVKAIPLTEDGIRAEWKAISLKSADSTPYFETFIAYCRELI